MKRNIFRNFSTFSTFRRCIALLLTVFLLSDTVNQYVSVSAAEADIEATDEESYTEDENVITVEIGEDGTVTTDIDSLLTDNTGSEEDDLAKESTESGTSTESVEGSTGSGNSTESVDASDETEPDGSESSDDMENADIENSDSTTLEESDADMSEEVESDIEEVEVEEVSFDSVVEDVTITVSGDTETLADVYEISVQKCDEDRVSEYNDILSEIEGYEESEAIGVYDITLLNEDGEAIEPSGTVTVTFTSTALIEQLQERDELTVFHNVDTVLQEDEKITADEQEIPEVKAESLEIIDTDITVSEGTLVFETDAFSEYALVLTGNDTQVESEVDDDIYMEFDKYLVGTGGEINGQSTYDIYMETALNGVYSVEEEEAPTRQDLIMCVDETDSVWRYGSTPISDYDMTALVGYVEDCNEGLLSFLNAILAENQERIANAKAGKYSDINPKSSTLTADMDEHLIHIYASLGFGGDVVHLKYWAESDSSCEVLLTSSQVTTLYNKIKLDPALVRDRSSYEGLGTPYDAAFEDGFLAYINKYKASHGGTLSGTQMNCVFITDGFAWDMNHSFQYVINIAQQIKDMGVNIWCVYEGFGNSNTYSGCMTAYTNAGGGAAGAYAAMQYLYNKQISGGTGGGCAALIYLEILSSDFVGGGTYNGSHSKCDSYAINKRSTDDFNKYTYIDTSKDWAEIPSLMESMGHAIGDVGETGKETGYASSSSYFIEEITDPFEITDTSAVTVYQVPRIPVNLDDDGIPTSMNENGIVEDGEFRWGEQAVIVYDTDGETILDQYSEWEDITDQVDITISGNIIKVTGYDYETNAVTDYDKDCAIYWTSLITEDDRVYESGDYGYKLVLVVGINAKTTFGGNGIATNNSQTTAFYPSTPQNSELPEWTNNTELNPEGNTYIEKYPVPTVDLTISYDVVYDDITIYAPQTAELLNLVTDEEGYLFYVDSAYSDLKTANDNAYIEYETALETYEAAQAALDEADSGDSNYSDLQEAVLSAESDYMQAYKAYIEANEAMSAVANYTPDGINNAFVDITFTLTDPNGTVVGTLTIPHGTEYVTYDDGTASIEWDFIQDNITTSGTYTLTCKIEPVNTTASPSGHVYVESDDSATKSLYGYSSTQYSSTGSTASGTQPTKTYTANPTAYIFQLKITAKDTRLEYHQTLDFYEGNENLLLTENPHLVSYEWVCTDGVTESNSDDEPGITGLMKVGGGVTITSQIPEQAEDEELVTDILGTVVTNVENGEWIPVSVLLSRQTGNLNKSVDTITQVTQTLVYMTDDDNLYGDGVSSVIWAHECDTVDDCDDTDFSDAQSYNTAEDDIGRGKVRYLIHVQDNPNPDITKTTSTPLITVGSDIKWNIEISNDNETTNEYHNLSDFTMVDILPYVGDGRIDPETNNEGSIFGGDLYYVSIILDSSNSPKTLALLESGEAGLYYTDDTTVRTTDIAQIMGTSVNDDNIEWEMADFTIDGTTVTFVVSADAVAVKFVTTLLWEESLSFDMTANVSVLTDQSVGDYYHNQAFVTTGNGQLNSEVVATTVISPYISGTVWEDSDFDGLMLDTETRIEGVSVTIYREYNKNNSGTIIRTIDGINLEKVYDNNGDEIGSYLTEEDGYYIFDNLPAGTYYIVVDLIPDQYDVTEKQTGSDDVSSALIDSEAEESLLTGQDSSLSKSAWIKEVTIATSVAENENVGLINILGSITIGKTLNEIYFPTTMTDEEQADYKVMFEFQLTGPDGTVYTDALKLDKDTYYALNGEPQVYVSFEDLPLGTYTLTEMSTAYYEISDVSSDSDNVSYNSTSMTATITLTSDDYDISVRVDNEFTELPPPGGDGNGVENWINMRIPVSLEIIYVGAYTISSTSLTSYTFVESDFAPSKGGDIIVTYDDGSTISLSAGTLDFDDITLSPGTVTNVMNSDDPTTITGYYSEKGRTLRDSYKVIVDLKPVHKFTLNFDANGSTFDTASTRNSVYFGYDEINASNYVISGTYKDISNGGLKSRGSSYTFAGWNTKNDGTGIAYDSFTALNAIGKDSSISALTLYANWKTNVTFNANGGVITKGSGTSTAEKALADGNHTSGIIKYNVNQTIATGLTGTKSGYSFVCWNTKADGTGINLEKYGKITKPVTFYAIYFQSDYYYTGGMQSMKVPVSGTYTVYVYGAQGGTDEGSSGTNKGGYTTGQVHLTAGETIYICVGQAGGAGDYAAYNGGGYGRGKSALWAAGGGGASHIATKTGTLASFGNASVASQYVIAVAGGGGGESDYSSGGSGGGTSGGHGGGSYGGSGGTQTSGYAFGQGQSAGSFQSAGGGGGWYGGYAVTKNNKTKSGGGGGSGYIGSRLKNGSMSNGVQSGNGFIRIILTSKDS